MDYFKDSLHICIGHAVWFMGFALTGLGISGVLVKEEHVSLFVTLFSIPSAGQAQGLALRLRSLVHPKNRTSILGILALVGGVILMLFGSSILQKARST